MSFSSVHAGLCSYVCLKSYTSNPPDFHAGTAVSSERRLSTANVHGTLIPPVICGAVVVVIIWSPSLKHPRQEKSALLDLIAQLFFQIFCQEKTGQKQEKQETFPKFGNFTEGKIFGTLRMPIFLRGKWILWNGNTIRVQYVQKIARKQNLEI